MNVPFFQDHLHCGVSYHDRSLSAPPWINPEDWVQSTNLHESKASSPNSPKDRHSLQQSDSITGTDQHDMALALCVDDCGECDDPTCSEPDCEADLIECTEASCQQPPVPGACHGNNTLCAGNLPPDVLDGAVSLAALKPPSSSYSHVYALQPAEQYLPLCVAIAAGYYNPEHIHSHLPHCGPHAYQNGYNDHAMFDGDHNIVPHPFVGAERYSFGSSPQVCQYPGMYYDIGAQPVSELSFQQQLPIKSPRSTVSPGPQQSFCFSQDSTPSATSSFSSPLEKTSVLIRDNTLMQPLSATDSFHTLLTCSWEIGHDIICSQTFETNAQLQSHVQQVHTASLRKAHGFTCQWKGCPRRSRGGESFAQRSKLDRHIQSHTGCGCSKHLSPEVDTKIAIDKASICNICGQQFSTTQSLVLHQRTHSGEKPHKCPFPDCGYAAAQASQLSTLQVYFPPNFLLSVPFNSRLPSRLTRLLIAMHNRTKHTKEKPLKCDFPNCTARFAESSNLSKHKKIHLPEAQCTCPLCFKSFSRDDQLKRHLKTHAKKAYDAAGRMESVDRESQKVNFGAQGFKGEKKSR